MRAGAGWAGLGLRARVFAGSGGGAAVAAPVMIGICHRLGVPGWLLPAPAHIAPSPPLLFPTLRAPLARRLLCLPEAAGGAGQAGGAHRGPQRGPSRDRHPQPKNQPQVGGWAGKGRGGEGRGGEGRGADHRELQAAGQGGVSRHQPGWGGDLRQLARPPARPRASKRPSPPACPLPGPGRPLLQASPPRSAPALPPTWWGRGWWTASGRSTRSTWPTPTGATGEVAYGGKGGWLEQAGAAAVWGREGWLVGAGSGCMSAALPAALWAQLLTAACGRRAGLLHPIHDHCPHPHPHRARRRPHSAGSTLVPTTKAGGWITSWSRRRCTARCTSAITCRA